MRFPNPSRALRRGGIALDRALGVLILMALVARTGLVYWWHSNAKTLDGSFNKTNVANFFSGHVFDKLEEPSFTTVLASPSSRDHSDQWPTAVHHRQYQRLNVLLIVADDLRPELSTYGRHTHTPHLTRLAKRGVTFDRAYAQVTVCNPSRVSFMTGRRPDSTKVWHFEHSGRSDWTSIPRVFADHGFTSVGVGKLWHMPTGPGGADTQFPHTEAVGGHRYFPDSMNFQHLLNHERRSQNATVTPLRRLFDYAPGDVPAPGQTYNARPYAPAGEFIDVQFADRALHLLRVLAKKSPPSPPTPPQNDDDALTLAARQSAARAAGQPPPRAVPPVPSDANAPWFLGVGFHAPHEPWVFPREYWDLYPQNDEEAAALAAAARDQKDVNKHAKHFDSDSLNATTVTDRAAHRSHWCEPNYSVAAAITSRRDGAHSLPCPRHWQQPSGVPRYAVGDVQSPFAPLYDQGGTWADRHYCRNDSSVGRLKGVGNRPPLEAFLGEDVDGEGPNIPEVCTLEEVKNGFRRFVRKRLPRNQGEDYAYEVERPPMPYAAQQELLRGYSAAVSFMDSQVGRLLDVLDDFNLRESTLVVFCADHGFSIGDLGQWGKRSLFEQDARVPFIVSDPTRPSSHGTRSTAIIELVDVLPTLAHLSGLNAIKVAGAPLAGFSLAHLLIANHGMANSMGSRRRSSTSSDNSRSSRVNNFTSSYHPSYYKNSFKEDVEGGRAGAVTQFVRCPITSKVSKLRRAVVDFRNGITNAITHSCVRDVRGWDWYTAHELVVMGYSLRTREWRYTAWLLWDPNTTAPVWRYPPLHEELYDHRNDDDDDHEGPIRYYDSAASAVGTATYTAAAAGGTSQKDTSTADASSRIRQFDAFEGVSLGRLPQWARLRFVLFLALRTLVEKDVDGDLQGGRHMGLRGLVQLGQELFLPPDNVNHDDHSSVASTVSREALEDSGVLGRKELPNSHSHSKSRFWSPWSSSTRSSSSDGWSGSNGDGHGPTLGSPNSQTGPLPAWLAAHLDHLDLFPPPVLHPEGLPGSSTLGAQGSSSATSSMASAEVFSNSTTAENVTAERMFWGRKKKRYEQAGLVWPRKLSAADVQMLEWEPLLRPGDDIEVADTSLTSQDTANTLAGNTYRSNSRGRSGNRGIHSVNIESLQWEAATVVAAIPRVTLRGELGAALDLKLGAGSSHITRAKRSRIAPIKDRGEDDEEGGEEEDKLHVHVPSRLWPEGESPLRWSWRPSKHLRDKIVPGQKRR